LGFTTICATAAEAVAGIPDGATVMIGGFGPTDAPTVLVEALAEAGPRNLTIVCNGPTGTRETRDSSLLVENGQVARVICSFPVGPSTSGGPSAFERQFRAGEVELELVPQGTLNERIRAGGAGIGAFFTPTGAGTQFADGKEVRTIAGEEQVLEYALHADVALVRAHRGDTMGNLVYRLARRNFNPAMATAATLTIAEVAEVVPVGTLDPDAIVTPGIFVDRLVQRQGVGGRPPTRQGVGGRPPNRMAG
jgi:3-oxoadipate CoA-transferase alpha subunit